MRIGNSHVIIALEIHEFFVALGKLVGLNAEAMLNALVFAIDTLNWDGSTELVAEFKIDDFADAIFDIALRYQTGLIWVLEFWARDFWIGQLINLVTLEIVGFVGVRVWGYNKWIEFFVLFFVIIGVYRIGKHDDHFIGQFLGLHLRRMRPVEHFKAIFKKCLCFVVCSA